MSPNQFGNNADKTTEKLLAMRRSERVQEKTADDSGSNFDDLDEILIKPVSREEEKELYAGFFLRLHNYYTQGQLDFRLLAEKTGYRRRRIRESLLFRIGTGEIMQLFGVKKGFCYICEDRIRQKSNTEAVCLQCLHKVESVLQETYGGASSEGTVNTIRVGEEGSSQTLPEPEPVIAEYEQPAEQEAGEEDDIDALKKQLAYYKKLVDENLEPEDISPPEAIKAEEVTVEIPQQTEVHTDIQDVESVEEPVAVNPVSKEDEAFLAILEMDDADVDEDSITLPEDVEAHIATQTIRHFGFKRFKLEG